MWIRFLNVIVRSLKQLNLEIRLLFGYPDPILGRAVIQQRKQEVNNARHYGTIR